MESPGVYDALTVVKVRRSLAVCFPLETNANHDNFLFGVDCEALVLGYWVPRGVCAHGGGFV